MTNSMQPPSQREALETIKDLPPAARFAGLLAVLLVGLLTWLAALVRDKPELLTLLIVSAVLLIGAAILSVHSLIRVHREAEGADALDPAPASAAEAADELELPTFKYDVFLATPYALAAPKQQPELADKLVDPVTVIRDALTRVGLKVYAPLLDAQFSAKIADQSLGAVLRRVEKSRVFVLLLTEDGADERAGWLMTLGIALAHDKRCLVFVGDYNALPYSLRLPGKVGAAKIDVILETDAGEIAKLLMGMRFELEGHTRPTTRVS